MYFHTNSVYFEAFGVDRDKYMNLEIVLTLRIQGCLKSFQLVTKTH